jgi:membrane fusion protein (multidrug efflux system)
MIQWFQRHFVAVVLVTAAVALTAAVSQRLMEESASGGGPPGGGSTPVVSAEVIHAPFVDTLQAVGSAVADESVEITATVSDRVTRIAFQEGEIVQAGDLLVQLDTEQEEAELAEALANLDEQRRQLRRFEALLATNAAAASQRDEALSRVEGAEARVQAIRARITDRRITAPFTGQLGLREVSPGAFVAPGARITTLDAIQPIKLDFAVPEHFLASLRQGASIRARTVAYPDRIFEGTVAHISPRVDPVTRAVTIRAALPNDDAVLRPGMLLVVDLVQDRRRSLVVPEAALIPEGQRQYVYRIVDGAAERVEVRIGARRPGIVEITEGITAGDRVVVEGALRLRPGGAVTVQREIDVAGLVPAEARACDTAPAPDPMPAAGAAEVGG